MPRLSTRTPAAALALVAGAFAFTACSESPVGPNSSLRSSDANFSVTANGTTGLTIASNGSTLYCSTSQLNGGNNAVGDWTIPTTFTGTGCTAAGTTDLTSALNVYNPGWSQPFAGSDWIGITTKGGPSSDYRANPGRYVFQETFTVPTGVTNPTLSLDVKSDNVAAVYLNGVQIGAQANTDCNPGVTCNWNSDLHISAPLTAGTTYTLTFVVSDLPTGFPITSGPTGGPAPQYACPTRPAQDNGTAGYTSTLVPTRPNHIVAGGGAGTPMTNIGTATQAGCENPMGLDFFGTVSWTTSTAWCSPGYWKNHLDSWSTADQSKLYSTLGSWAAPLSKKAPTSGPGSNPTLLQVVSDPSTYGGPATNSVADYLSNKLFGTPIGSGIEGCPLN